MKTLIPWDLIFQKRINPNLFQKIDTNTGLLDGDEVVALVDYRSFNPKIRRPEYSEGFPISKEGILSGATGSSFHILCSDRTTTWSFDFIKNNCILVFRKDFEFLKVQVRNEQYCQDSFLGSVNKTTNILTTKKDLDMKTRFINIYLFDDDASILNAENRLVAKFKDVCTDVDDATTIQEIIMSKNVAKKIARHNERRASMINQTVLMNTGAEVMLQPVRIHQLRWDIKG